MDHSTTPPTDLGPSPRPESSESGADLYGRHCGTEAWWNGSENRVERYVELELAARSPVDIRRAVRRSWDLPPTEEKKASSFELENRYYLARLRTVSARHHKKTVPESARAHGYYLRKQVQKSLYFWPLMCLL